MKNIKLKYLMIGALILSVFSCSKKLDLFPQNDLTPDKVYKDYNGYMQVLAKLYGAMSVGGNQGPSGQPDISGNLDEGSQIAFIRPFFNCEELPTDEAVCYWNDQTIKNYHYFKFDANDPFIKGIYARLMWNVKLANEFISESSDATLASKGITGANLTDLQNARNEARFLRAFNYWAMIDLFGKSSFITENDVTGTLPKEISRANLFTYVSNELKAIETLLPAAKTATYGRVDRAAAWALMARLHLNANVYLGTSSTKYYDTAITYASKVIAAGYTLHSKYNELFMADNDKCTDEIIWAIECDGLKTQGYGNTTFIINASCYDDKPYYFSGPTTKVGDGWAGYTATKNLWTTAFSSDVNDKRALFTTYSDTSASATVKYNTNASQIEITPDLLNVNESWFKDPANGTGVHVAKFRNVRSDGKAISDVLNYTYSDIDFPVFRLPEMYLIYAEAVLRGGTGGSASQAVSYVNLLRQRAYGNTTGNVSSLTLDDILNERGRELYWEGHRRTDLIRYGYLTSGSYLWPWKGGIKGGTGVDSKYNLFPIPASVLNSNTNLSQNTGF